MATVTKPILLDETGQSIVSKLGEIKDALATSSQSYTKAEVDALLATKVPEAPQDSKQYARQDSLWTEIESGGAGIPEYESVTITITKNDGSVFANKQINLLIDGNTTRTLTSNASGVCTTTISGGSTYVIEPDSVDDYTSPLQTYVACLQSRSISVVYTKNAMEVVNVSVAYACNVYGQPTIYSTQQVIFTDLGTGVTTRHSLNTSNKVTLQVPYGTHYSLSVDSLDGYYVSPLVQYYVAGQPRRDVSILYRNSSNGIYLVKSDGSEELYDPDIDYRTYEDKANVIAIGFKSKALSDRGCCFAVAKTNYKFQSNMCPNATTIAGLSIYTSTGGALADYDGKSNTDKVIASYASTGFKSATTKTLVINGETLYGFIGSAAQMQLIYSNFNYFKTLVMQLWSIDHGMDSSTAWGTSTLGTTTANCIIFMNKTISSGGKNNAQYYMPLFQY